MLRYIYAPISRRTSRKENQSEIKLKILAGVVTYNTTVLNFGNVFLDALKTLCG